MRKRYPKSGAAAPAVADTSTISIPASALFGGAFGGVGLSGYQGAQWSTNRGMIYWNTLDPTKEMDPYTRLEIARRLHFLKANVGLTRRMGGALTSLVVGGGLWPKALTRDLKWNRLATNYYFNRGKSPVTYDVRGKFAASSFQRMAVRTKFDEGDAAVVYAYSQSGRLMRKLYSGLQIGNAATTGDTFDQSRWIDGVFPDALERAALYRFLTADGKRSADIPADKMAFLARYPTPGAYRGESIFCHAVNKLIDLTEIRSAWIQNIKNSAQIGYYIAADQTPAGSSSMPDEVVKRILGNRAQPATVGTGADAKKITLKLVMGNGNEIAELPPGYDIKTLLDQRPHGNQIEFHDEIVRDIANGTELSFDLLWKIYKLGGANTRYVLADAQVFAEKEQDDLIFTWLMRDYAQTIAAGLACGDLPPCEDPEWWNHGWLPPSRITVDFGRDGRIYLEEYSRGLITTERYYALKGLDAKEEFTAECEFAVYRREEMERHGLTEKDFAYLRAGAPGAAQPAQNDSQDNPDDETTTKTDNANNDE